MNDKRLSAEMVIKSPEIQDWLSQFEETDRSTAQSLLLQLKFISRDTYARWVLSELEKLTSLEKVGVFAVRKFNEGESVWDDSKIGQKSSKSQGSEDLVLSIISQAKKLYPDVFFDHPSINEIRSNRIHHIVLLDDSIGSGKRVSGYLKNMVTNKSFISWISGGFVTIHIVSYARTIQAEKVISKDFPGNNHKRRVRQLSDKLIFDSFVRYDGEKLQHRWGDDFEKIVALCNHEKNIPKARRRGYGNVMANMIFYHSVPNNIPGMLYCGQNKGWTPLFPGRVLPDWCQKLIDGYSAGSDSLSDYTKKQIFFLLIQLKRGLRTVTSLSRSIDSDDKICKYLLGIMIESGLLTPNHKITESGFDFLHDQQLVKHRLPYNFSLYIPKSWCTGQKEIQPSESIVETQGLQTDPIEDNSVGGEGGLSSLERTDAMAPPSPIVDMTTWTSWPRGRHLDHDPSGFKG